MIPIADYHMHTPLCGHATGEPSEYAQTAVKLGLEEIGFTDHAPFVHMEDPNVTMNIKQLPDYYRMIEDVRKEYNGSLRIKIAIEADYIPGYESQTKGLLRTSAHVSASSRIASRPSLPDTSAERGSDCSAASAGSLART